MKPSTEHLVPVQADALNDTERADTELARQAANLLGWQIQPYFGVIHDHHGEVLTTNIEELGQAARLLGWFNPHGPGFDRRYFDQANPDEAAEAVRSILTQTNETSSNDTP